MQTLERIKNQLFSKNRITPDEIAAFTEGDCWALALGLRQKHGFPVAFIGAMDNVSGADEDFHWVHAFNVLPNGKYLDVQGVHTHEEILKKWSRDVEKEIGEPVIFEPSHKLALKILMGFELWFSLSVPETIQKLEKHYL